MKNIDLNADVIDVREIIERVEALREAKQSLRDEFDEEPTNAGVDFEAWARNQVNWSSEESDELTSLETILADLAGSGGDEQWDGDWYPLTLIADWHFKDYAQELADDLDGSAIDNAIWPFTCIDWERAARELRMDYTSTEIDGNTYWYR